MSQQDVAAHFGISRAAVAYWETGGSRPDQAKLAKLSGLLGVSLSEMLECEDVPASKEEVNELTEAWGLLLDSERADFLAQIKQRAAHNRQVMEAFKGKPTPPMVERRTGGIVFYGGPERRKEHKNAN